MSFLDRLGAAVGIGACQVRVSLQTPEVTWGDTVRGTVTLTGGKVPQKVDWLAVNLVEHWTTTVGEATQQHAAVHAESTVGKDFTIQPGEERTFDVELVVPDVAAFGHLWYVDARVGIPGAVDSRNTEAFRLVPPPVFTRLAEVMTEVSGLPVGYWMLHEEGVAAEFPATGDLYNLLDGVRLEMARRDGKIEGAVELNLQEKTAADVIRSVKGGDRKRFPLSVAEDDLEGARAQFQQALAGFRG